MRAAPSAPDGAAGILWATSAPTTPILEQQRPLLLWIGVGGVALGLTAIYVAVRLLRQER